jgi:hypothetical protein
MATTYPSVRKDIPSKIPGNGDIGSFDPGDSMQTAQTNFHFTELNFHLERLCTNASHAKMPI